MVSVPLLALLIPVQVAAPVAVLASIAVATIVVVQDWRHVQVGSAGRLVCATLFGVPLGLVLLKSVPESALKTVLGGMILAFSIYSLSHRETMELHDDRFAWVFGFAAGVFGGAYGLNGPPLAVYGCMRGWSPAKFRVTLQGYFLPASIAGMCGFAFAGFWTHTVDRLFLWSLPSIAVGTLAGRVINRRLKAGQFLRYVHVGLCVIAVVLLVQAARSR